MSIVAEDIFTDQDRCTLGCQQHVNLFKTGALWLAMVMSQFSSPSVMMLPIDPFHVNVVCKQNLYLYSTELAELELLD